MRLMDRGRGELEVRASDLKIIRLSERAVLPTRGRLVQQYLIFPLQRRWS